MNTSPLFSSISRTFLIVSILICVVTCLFIIAPRAQAATIPIQGYAWSNYLGWIHFNGSGYGVSQDSGSGTLSGYAWSTNLGWITFNESQLSGCPSGACKAKVSGSGAVTGWARSCAAFANKNACSGALDTGTGPAGLEWDGWIHLSGTGYGLTSTDGCWSGYAWGSQNIGAIKFAGTAQDGSPYRVGDTSCGTARLPDLISNAVIPYSDAYKANIALRMSIGLEPLDLAYDLTNDGMVKAADALAFSRATEVAEVGRIKYFYAKVANAGPDASIPTTAVFPNIFQIADSSQNPLFTIAASSGPSNLAVGASTTISGSYTFTTTGQYNARTCTNVNTSGGGSIPESATGATNNCGAWMPFTVYPVLTIGSFTASPANIAYGSSSTLSWSGVTGGGTITCSIDNGVGSATPVASGSKSSGARTTSTTFTITCTNDVGQSAEKQTIVTVAGNQPPSDPIITGPTTGLPLTNYTYSFSSTDPESNTIRYQIDWDNNGTVDQSLPSATTYVSSGTSQSQANNWEGEGVKTFSARTVDSVGATSGWTLYTVTISCASGSTWGGSACVTNVAIGSFTASPANIAYGSSSTLSWSGVTGGGTITCSIDNGGGSASVPSGSKSSPTLITSTTFTLTCQNGVGPNATRSTPVSVAGAPSGALTVPASCVISGGASTCTVPATWTTLNSSDPKLIDVNTGTTLSTAANQSSPGLTVWVAYPQTVFNLKDGSSVLDPKTVTASCASGSTWVGNACIVLEPDLVACGAADDPNDCSTVAVPAVGTTGQGVSFYTTITNRGNGTATNFPNVFQIGTDSEPVVGLMRINAGNVASLGVTISANISVSYATTTPGSYKVRACANMDTVGEFSIDESNELNNCGDWTRVSIVNPTMSATCTVSPDTALINTPFTWTVSNVTGGGGPGSYTYSWTGGPGPGDTLSSNTTSVEKSYTAPGTKTGTVTITSAGNQQTFVCKNSLGTSGVTVTSLPDLTSTSAPIVSPTSGGVGLRSFSGFVANIGAATATTTFPNIFQITSTSTGQQVSTLVNADSVTSLTVNESKPISGSYTFPTQGTYTVRACANFGTSWGGSIQESNGLNNCSTETYVIVAGPPVVGTLSGTGCVLPAGGGSCTIRLNWAASGTNNDQVDLRQRLSDGTIVTTPSSTLTLVDTAGVVSNPTSFTGLPADPELSFAVSEPGSYSFTLYDHGTETQIGSTIPISSCASGYTINPITGACVLPDRPNLTVSDITPVEAVKNIPITLFAIVTNGGTATTGSAPFNNIIQIDDNANHDNGIADTIVTNTLSSLAGSDESDIIFGSYTFTSNQDHYARACADLNESMVGSVTESNEGDNCGSDWTIISITNNSVDGVCAPDHYMCSAGTSVNNVDNTSTHKYTWECAGLNGGATSTACVEPKTPTAFLNANPRTIDQGESTQLFWSSTNATSCTSAGGFSTGGVRVSPPGGVSSGPLTETSTFQVTCSNPGATSVPAQVTVTVLQPELSITAEPSRVVVSSSSGVGTTTITWTASLVQECTVTGPGGSFTGNSGSQEVTVSGQATYTLSCLPNDPGGGPPPPRIVRKIIVNPVAAFQEF